MVNKLLRPMMICTVLRGSLFAVNTYEQEHLAEKL